ncbi:hypothetical protein IJ670_05440 [bacterium]|nr:hypothetical protein [bacterium]
MNLLFTDELINKHIFKKIKREITKEQIHKALRGMDDCINDLRKTNSAQYMTKNAKSNL